MGPQGQRQLAATYTREGHANEGWQIDKDVVSKICTDFDDILFETVVKSVCSSAEMNWVLPQRPGWCLAAGFNCGKTADT